MEYLRGGFSTPATAPIVIIVIFLWFFYETTIVILRIHNLKAYVLFIGTFRRRSLNFNFPFIEFKIFIIRHVSENICGDTGLEASVR